MTEHERTFPFDFLHMAPRDPKPRQRGLTEIRGPYYDAVGKRRLKDILETVGHAVDGFKFSGGSFALMPRPAVEEMLGLCHEHGVEVSTGGFIERVLPQGKDAVDRYIDTCAELGFDTLEISSGFISLPTDDWERLVERVRQAGMKAKPELGIQFGAGGTSSVEALEAQGTRDPNWVINRGRRLLEAGASILMIESEGITEQVRTWRTDVIAAIIDGLGLENVMFEGSDPPVFTWYVKNYGPKVNLFVDHSQIVQLEALRRGIWGTQEVWGRVVGYEG